MATLTILGSVAAIIVAVITIWNTDTLSRQRLRVQRALQARRQRREHARQVACFASQPALVELEARFDELAGAYEAKQIPHDLCALRAEVFRLAGDSPVGRPFQYGALEVHRDMSAMTVRKSSGNFAGRKWLEVYPIALAPRSAIQPSGAPVPAIKE